MKHPSIYGAMRFMPSILKRFRYKEAFIMSPKLEARVVKVETISDGIAILDALDEGKLMVSTQVRDKKHFPECTIGELRGKSEQEVFSLLDQRTDQLLRTNRGCPTCPHNSSWHGKDGCGVSSCYCKMPAP